MEEQEEARVLAEEVMGWQKSKERAPYAWAPGHIVELDGPWYRNNNGITFLIDDWHPHKNIAQAMMVLRTFPCYELFKTDLGDIGCNVYLPNGDMVLVDMFLYMKGKQPPSSARL